MEREVTCKVVHKFTDVNVRNDVIRTQIVQWNNGKPVFEKREYWYKDDQEKCGKLKGLTVEDIDFIFTHYAEIHTLMVEAKPAPKAEETKAPAASPEPAPAPVVVAREISE